MCMKNVNTNIIFADITSNDEHSAISLQNLGKNFYISVKDEKRKISSISFALYISASEERDFTLEDAEKVDNSIFVFSKQYEFRVRLTETISGAFKDLVSMIIVPADTAEQSGLCKKVFNCTKFCHFEDIELPGENAKERFVIKVVVREKTELENNQWFVQSIHPIGFKTIIES